MPQAIAKWRTRTGHRFTDAADELSVDVETITALATEGGIGSVVFTVNGVDEAVSTETQRQPNFNTEVSPRTGTTAMRPFQGYGITVRAADHTAGTITITAKVISANLTETPLPGSIIIYNDKGGANTRPSSRRIYVNADTGLDLNDGSEGSPVLSIQLACELAAEAGDLGGASVILQSSTAAHSWCRGFGGVDTLFTSGHWWFRIIVEEGATIQRPGAIAPNGSVTYTPGPDDLVLNSGGTNPIRCLLVLQDPINKQVTRGDLKVWVHADSYAELAVEGGRWGSRFHNASTRRWSVLFTEERTGLWDVVSGSANYRKTAYCCVAEGTSFSWFGWADLHDCEAIDFTGIACQSTAGHLGGESALNLRVAGQRYNSEVGGYIDSVVGGKVSVTNVGGRMRIQQLAATTINSIVGGVETSVAIDLGDQATDLLESARWGVVCAGFAESANNSPTLSAGTLGAGGRYTAFQVLAIGLSGGLPWIELDNSSAVSETTAQAGAQIRTGLRAGTSDPGALYTEAVHPDVCQFLSHLTDALWSGVVVQDVSNSQGWFFSNYNFTRVGFRNLTDGATQNVSLSVPLSMTDCLFFHCSIGVWQWGTGVTYAGLEFRQCVVGTTNGLPAAATIDGCHFIGSAAQGTNSSTGAWYAGDPNVDPWSLAPAGGNIGTASTNVLCPVEAFWWTGAEASTRGVWRDVGLDVVVPPPTPPDPPDPPGPTPSDMPIDLHPIISGTWDAPATSVEVVTPSDTVDLIYTPRMLYIGGAGNLSVITTGGQTVSFAAVPVGTILPLRVSRVRATGTTATAILALR